MLNDGMKLEDEVYELIHALLKEGTLPYQKEQCRIFRKKAYYSPDRDSDVHFENVIEVFSADNFNTPNAQPTHVIFFECKDHEKISKWVMSMKLLAA